MDLAHDISPEDIQAFLQEAEEHLQLLDEDFVRLEREKENPELLQEIFRAAHTLKGSAAMLGHQRMADLAHSMESLLDKVRKGNLSVTTQVVDTLLHSLDALCLLKDELITPEAAAVDIAATVAQLSLAENISSGETEADSYASENEQENQECISLGTQEAQSLQWYLDSGQNAYLVNVRFEPNTAWAAVRAFQVLESLAELGTVVKSSPSQEEVEAEQVGLEIEVILATPAVEQAISDSINMLDEIDGIEVIPYELPSVDLPVEHPQTVDRQEEQPPADDNVPKQRQQSSQTVRIDVERLDDMMNLIGELVIDRTRIAQIGKILESKYREDELIQALGKTSSHIEKIIDELQESTMKVRMLPIGTVFSGFPRMMRDLAQKVDKKIDFIVEGQDTEIDRTVIDRIRDPIVHLLRNCVDHGLESTEERRNAGKPEAGTIRLTAFHEQGHIVIAVEDDGKGIDAQKLKQSAVNKGVISSDTAARLSESEALDLIFLPGASTASTTTDLSGRGVGMDIVKSNIEAIHGFVNIDTRPGEGTRFTLRLPLTLATLRALLVSIDETIYAIPLVYVLEAVVIRPHEISTIEGNEVIRLRGNVIPLVRLRKVLDIADGNDNDESDHAWIVIVKFGEKLVGIAVDSLIELQEIVVKSLGHYIGDVKGVAGASILGDGRVVLILDVTSLISLAVQVSNSIKSCELAAHA